MARSIATHIKRITDRAPGRTPVEYWQKVLENRPNWQRIQPGMFQYKTGDRIEVAVCRSSGDLVARITVAEVKPLGEGLPPEVRNQLVIEAVVAAMQQWKRHAIP